MYRRGKVVIAFIVAIAALPRSPAMQQKDAGTRFNDQHHGRVQGKEESSGHLFPHETQSFKCIDCHHEYKTQERVEEGQEVKKCGACHKLEAQDRIVKLEKAYHDQCVNCHKKIKAEKKQTGPPLAQNVIRRSLEKNRKKNRPLLLRLRFQTPPHEGGFSFEGIQLHAQRGHSKRLQGVVEQCFWPAITAISGQPLFPAMNYRGYYLMSLRDVHFSSPTGATENSPVP